MSPRARWLELAADYRCNNRCVGCFSVQEHGATMSPRELLDALRLGRARGADALWLGGGEPTLRKDLLPLVRAARSLGYTRVKLQSNGMLLAYRVFAEKLREAGVTEVALSLKGSTENSHDARAQTPGGWKLLHEGLSHLRELGFTLEGDVLLYRSSTAELPGLVRHFHAEGLEHFRLWVLSTVDSPEGALAAEVPRLSEVAAALRDTLALELSARPDFLQSLHTPPCVLGAALERARFFAPELALLVVNPGGHSFMLEESPLEGGRYLEGCAGCAERARCGGLRADYLAIHGAEEFRPLPRAQSSEGS